MVWGLGFILSSPSQKRVYTGFRVCGLEFSGLGFRVTRVSYLVAWGSWEVYSGLKGFGCSYAIVFCFSFVGGGS